VQSDNNPIQGASPESVVRGYIDRLSRRDPSAFDLVAEDFVQHAAAPQGRVGLRQTVQVLEHDLTRPSTQIMHLMASGDFVFVHLVLNGVHGGSTMPLLHGIPISGTTVSWTFMHLLEVHDGLITEHWACRDDLGLLMQLGAWPPNQQDHSLA
jgi:predicted ester cyclase